MTSGLHDRESPTTRYREIVAAFLASFERPCGCPIDLREDDGLRCSSCDALFVARDVEGALP